MNDDNLGKKRYLNKLEFETCSSKVVKIKITYTEVNEIISVMTLFSLMTKCFNTI